MSEDYPYVRPAPGKISTLGEMRLDSFVARGSDSALRPGVSGLSRAHSGGLASGANVDLNKSTSQGSSKRLKQLEFQSSPWDFFGRIVRTCRMKPTALLANLLGNNPGSMKNLHLSHLPSQRKICSRCTTPKELVSDLDSGLYDSARKRVKIDLDSNCGATLPRHGTFPNTKRQRPHIWHLTRTTSSTACIVSAHGASKTRSQSKTL